MKLGKRSTDTPDNNVQVIYERVLAQTGSHVAAAAAIAAILEAEEETEKKPSLWDRLTKKIKEGKK